MYDPSPDPADWPSNYFNYFTEIEERFQQARGTSLFLLSPLDWALIETWKNGGIPLEAVLRGIDAAFEKWRARKQRMQNVNSLAYCAQAVLKEARQLAEVATGQPTPASGSAAALPQNAPFTCEAFERYLRENATALKRSPDPAIRQLADSLESLAEESEAAMSDLEDTERRLTAIEEKMLAALKLAQSEEELLQTRRELDGQLRPYRSKMSAEQLRQLEEQYLSRKLLEKAGLPRLSLFYMTDFGG